jgi:hypothetical protein
MTEMGPHPLRAGQRFTWQVVIPQQRHLNHWRVDVTCTERAVYTVATSSATHTHICYRKALRVPEELEMFDDQMALTGSTELPRDAMHSFSTKNNHVEWAIEVSGSVWGWFPVTFRFPFVLLPSETWT